MSIELISRLCMSVFEINMLVVFISMSNDIGVFDKSSFRAYFYSTTLCVMSFVLLPLAPFFNLMLYFIISFIVMKLNAKLGIYTWITQTTIAISVGILSQIFTSSIFSGFLGIQMTGLGLIFMVSVSAMIEFILLIKISKKIRGKHVNLVHTKR